MKIRNVDVQEGDLIELTLYKRKGRLPESSRVTIEKVVSDNKHRMIIVYHNGIGGLKVNTNEIKDVKVVLKGNYVK